MALTSGDSAPPFHKKTQPANVGRLRFENLNLVASLSAAALEAHHPTDEREKDA